MAMRYDTVVVGAGPAGAMAALVLAQAGYRVALLDKARFPRAKVCGDCLNPSAWSVWERHGLQDRFADLPHHVLEGVAIELNGEVAFRQDFDTVKRNGRVIDRSILDDWLVREAQAAGAEFFPETRVNSIETDGSVKTNQGDFSAQFILGADGRNSLVARLAGLTPPNHPCARVAWQTDIGGEYVDNHVHMHVFDDGYYGLARINATTANLCLVLGKQSHLTPQQAANRFFPSLHPCVWRSVYPIYRLRSKVGRGKVWLAGDAARVVEPFTGEGIYFALASGEAAACAMIHGFKTKNENEALRRYKTDHQALYRGRVEVNAFVQWATQSPQRAVRTLRFCRNFPFLMRTLLKKVQIAPRQPPPVAFHLARAAFE
jgi:geranylgeranyl reductase family protein